jgi:hypothetical protein
MDFRTKDWTNFKASVPSKTTTKYIAAFWSNVGMVMLMQYPQPTKRGPIAAANGTNTQQRMYAPTAGGVQTPKNLIETISYKLSKRDEELSRCCTL